MSNKIYILDEIVVQQMRAVDLRDAYMKRYVPAARARGMCLEGAWRSPPVEIEERLSTLHFLWSVADVATWWQMRLGAKRATPELDGAIEGDTDKSSWWRYVDSVAISRKRTLMIDACEEDEHV
jgi:hypothetical protein